MGVVYEVFDRRRRLSLALKTVPFRPEGISRFKREFRAVANLRHPNLIRLYDLGAEEDFIFYTMELVRGQDPRDYLGVASTFRDTVFDRSPEHTGDALVYPQDIDRRASPRFLADPKEVARILSRIAGALDFLHSQKKVHRDLKPENILVTEEGEPKLLDFGLIKDANLGERPERSSGIIGTPAYMAPEQLTGEKIGPPVDLYALGVLLFELLTARLPFVARNVMELLATRLATEAPRPSELTEDVPGPLEELCLLLLAKDPEARPSAREVVQFLSRAYQIDPPPPGRAPLPLLPLVGREPYRQDVLAAIKARRGVLLWPGAAGLGKTRLLREARSWMEQAGVLCLTGRCQEREAIPFRAFDRAIDALASHLSRISAAELGALGIEVGPLLKLFPVLASIPALARRRSREAVPDPTEERQRAFDALATLLAARAAQGPVAFLIDDLHLADEGSLRLLEALCARADEAPPPEDLEETYLDEDPPDVRGRKVRGDVVFVLTWRPEEAPPLLEELVSRLHATPRPLGPLAEPEAARLLQATSPVAVPPEALSAMLREAAGSPRWCIELGRAFSENQEEGVYTIHSLLRKRLSTLPEERLRVLIAVTLGGRLSFPVLASVTRLPEDVLAREIDELLLEELVRLFADPRLGDCYEASDRALAEAVYQSLSPDVVREWHRALAEALFLAGASPVLVAEQLAAAGERSRAAPLALRAAQEQKDALAFESAVAAYRQALALGLPAEDAERAREELAGVLYCCGRHDEASQEWRALAKERSGLARAQTILRAAEADLERNALDEALAGFEEVLIACDGKGASLTKSRGRVLASIAWGYLEGEARLRLLGMRRPAVLPPETALKLDLYILLAGHLTAFAPERSMECGARYLALAIKSGDPAHTCLALEIAAMHLSLAGASTGVKLAATYHKHSDELLPQVSEPRLMARRAILRGVSANARGDFLESISFMDDAEERLRAMGFGPMIEAVVTHNYGAIPELWMGRLVAAEERCLRVLRPARARGNLYAVAELCPPIVFSRLYRGDIKGARAALSEAPREILEGPPTLPKVNIRRAEVDLLLAEGNLAQARARYEDFTASCAQVISAPAWLRVEVAQLGLRLALAEQASGDARGLARGRALERAATADATPARLARSFRHLAELQLMAKDLFSARARLTMAEALLKRQEAPLEEAILLTRLATLDPKRQQEADRARAALGLAHPKVFEKWAW